ncbi:MAG: HesA/MoeB/ThiF family protein [Planctomycetota bacterium]
MPLSEEQILRYSRNILLSGVGGRGQERLLASRVLLVGAGGLGSPAGLYLAAAGVGTIGIADGDAVDLTNLQRQVAHTTDAVGARKTDSMAVALGRLNPDVTVERHGRLTEESLPLADYEVVLDGSDNFETRFMVNDAAVRGGVPLVSAAVLRFEGQLTTVLPGEGNPCYRCLYPAAPPEGSVPTCSQAGVLGSVAGTMGTLQATEALKVLLGAGDPLVGKLLLYDALTQEFRKVSYGPDPECAACRGGRG